MLARSFIAALFSAVAYAQSTANPFKLGSNGLSASAGQPLKLEWNPTTEGTVSLILRSGSSSNLAEGTTIANNIDNTGSFTWNVPASITRGSDYAIEIVNPANPSETNYTPLFTIDSSNTAPASTAIVSLGAPTSSLDLPTASATVSPTTKTASASASATGSSQIPASSTATSSGAASSAAASATGTAATTGVEVQTGAAAARATAAAGVLGAIALGALAL